MHGAADSSSQLAETFAPAEQETRLSIQLVLAATEEQNRELSQTLHDTLCQTLAGTVFMASVLSTQCKEGQPVDPAELDTLCEHLSRALDEARAISARLQPVQPRVDGLMLALERLAQETSARIPCSYTCEKPALIRDPDVALAVFRIAQDAVRNAQARAEATHVEIALSGANDLMTLTIRDDGRGATAHPAEEQSEDSALMRCRAHSVGGTLISESPGERGTIVTCIVPKARKPADASR